MATLLLSIQVSWQDFCEGWRKTKNHINQNKIKIWITSEGAVLEGGNENGADMETDPPSDKADGLSNTVSVDYKTWISKSTEETKKDTFFFWTIILVGRLPGGLGLSLVICCSWVNSSSSSLRACLQCTIWIQWNTYFYRTQRPFNNMAWSFTASTRHDGRLGEDGGHRVSRTNNLQALSQLASDVGKVGRHGRSSSGRTLNWWTKVS